MLIEFIGPPGSGKTTLARRIIQSLGAQPGRRSLGGPGLVTSVGHVAGGALRMPIGARKWLADPGVPGARNRMSTRQRLGCFHWLARYTWLRPRHTLHVFDQGALQAVDFITLRWEGGGRRAFLERFYRHCAEGPLPQIVVGVSAPIELVLERLAARESQIAVGGGGSGTTASSEAAAPVDAKTYARGFRAHIELLRSVGSIQLIEIDTSGELESTVGHAAARIHASLSGTLSSGQREVSDAGS